MNYQRLIRIFVFLLIISLPFSYAQVCPGSLSEKDVQATVDHLRESVSTGVSEEYTDYILREIYETAFLEKAISLGVSEKDAQAYIDSMKNRPLTDLATSTYAIGGIRERYKLTDYEIKKGIENKDLLVVIKRRIIIDEGEKSDSEQMSEDVIKSKIFDLLDEISELESEIKSSKQKLGKVKNILFFGPLFRAFFQPSISLKKERLNSLKALVDLESEKLSLRSLSLESLSLLDEIESSKLGKHDKKYYKKFIDQDDDAYSLLQIERLLRRIDSKSINDGKQDIDSLEDMVSKSFVSDKVADHHIDLKQEDTLDELVSSVHDYHRTRIGKSELVSRFDYLVEVPKDQETEDYAKDYLKKTNIRPRTYYISTFSTPIAFEGFFGQTYIVHLLETLNAKMLISDTSLHFPEMMQEFEVFNPDRSLNEVNAKEFLRALVLITHPEAIYSDDDIDNIYNSWLQIHSGRNSLDTSINNAFKIGNENREIYLRFLRGDFTYLDYITKLNHEENEYDYVYEYIHLNEILKDIEKSSDEQVIIEIETVPSSRRMVLAIKALNEGRLIRTNDGRFLDIKDVAIDEEGVITVGTKNKNKKFSPNEYEVIMPKNVGGKKVNIKTVMRLHLTPKSIRVLMKEDIPPIGDLLSETNVFLEKHNPSRTEVKEFLENVVLPMKSIFNKYGNAYGGRKKDFATFEKFISNFDTDSGPSLVEVLNKLNTIATEIKIEEINKEIEKIDFSEIQEQTRNIILLSNLVKKFLEENENPDEETIKIFIKNKFLKTIEDENLDVKKMNTVYGNFRTDFRKYDIFVHNEKAREREPRPDRNEILKRLRQFSSSDHSSKITTLRNRVDKIKDDKKKILEVIGVVGDFLIPEIDEEDVKTFIIKNILPIKESLTTIKYDVGPYRWYLGEDLINKPGGVPIPNIRDIIKNLKTLSDLDLIKKANKERTNFEIVIQNIDSIIAVGPEVKSTWESYFKFEELRSNGKDLITVIDNDLLNIYEVTHEEKKQKKTELLDRLGVPNPEDKIVISYVGRIHDEKGYAVLESIMRELSDDDRYVFIIGTDGSGNMGERFKEFLNEDEGRRLRGVDEGDDPVSGQFQRIFAITDITKNGNIVFAKVSEDNKREAMLKELKDIQSKNVEKNFKGYPNDIHNLESFIPVQVASDIYVHPSWFEAKPGSVIEANRAHAFIITTKKGGMRSSVDKAEDVLVKRVDVIGDDVILTWEESFEEMVEYALGLGRKRIYLSDGTEINIKKFSLRKIIDILSNKKGETFSIGNINYKVGKDMLSVEETRKMTEEEKRIIEELEFEDEPLEDTERSLSPESVIESLQYIKAIKKFTQRIDNNDFKKTKFTKPKMVSRTYEHFSDLIKPKNE